MSEIDKSFLKPYSSKETEGDIYALWEKSGFFNPDICVKKGVIKKDAKPYSIMMPPPNVTGVLHMGHALTLTIEDIFIRYKRMRGFKTLWLPGTDHAAIATQSKVEKELSKKEKKNRHDLGRDEFLKRVETFAKESHDTIVKQVKAMGASCDWSREAFTLDETRSHAVNTAFKAMYEDKLIYRGNRIVNWDPKGQTTISDEEIVHEKRSANLVTFKYQEDFPIPIATTRLETKLGDTGVAVHPDDKRYKKFIGKEYDVTFCGVPLHLKVVADESVDPEFGTGAVGVTPAHSQIDWEIAKRHNLPCPQVIDEKARITIDDKKLNGLKTTEARDIILAQLKDDGLVLSEEEIEQNVGTAERTGGIVEPLPKLQWFIDVNKSIPSRENKTLKELMREPVENGEITIIPDRFSKTYFHWIDNLRDWCISRQIWYGHQIPVWYHENKCIPIQGREEEVSECEMLIVSSSEPKCQHCNAKYIQDPDTLDTWFSSGLWTFSTLGWPDETADLSTYHPTDMLETGYDILFFWVARMILMSKYHLGTIPFHTVYLHGLVRDEKGKKMSKSLGNFIDPLTSIEKFGADAARMSLIAGGAPGNDLRLSEDKIRGYKHYANKIWNITRFVLENIDGLDLKVPYSKYDQRIWNKFGLLAKDITRDIENYQLHLASEKIYHYIWHEFADAIIEHSKTIFAGESPDELGPEFIASRKKLLYSILMGSLKLLHPFMPFVTEAIWQKLPTKDSDILMVAKWPTPQGREVGQV